MKGRKNDIKIIEANTQGKDYIIGDLHGNRDTLEEVLIELGLNDRLFIVGDLTDRGADSIGVIDLLNKIDEKYPDTIHVIHGNHETLALNCINGLETMAKKLMAFSKEDEKKFIKELKEISTNEANIKYGKCGHDICHHVHNGGKWMIKLFINELQKGHITIDQKNKIRYKSDSMVKSIIDYMKNLPYIMHVKGNETNLPFHIVHADMPFDDMALQRRLAQGKGLSPKEKKYATWARQDGPTEIVYTGRSSYSIVTYVGHSIVTDGKVPAIRYSTNTINLDVETYNTDICAFYCHTDGTCRYVGSGINAAEKNECLSKILIELNQKRTNVKSKFNPTLFNQKPSANADSAALEKDVDVGLRA